MKPGEASIDWSTAKIEATDRPDSLNLSVKVSGGSGVHWRIAFQNMVQNQNQAQMHRTRPWGSIHLGGDGGRFGGTTIEVGGVRAGTEDDLKAQLDHLAKLASENAVPKEENDARLQAELRQEKEERAAQAAEMEERLRVA